MANQVAIITGASRGIGLATALRLARAGCDIVAAARNETDLRRAAEQISGAGTACEPVPVDVGAPAAAPALIKVARERFGRIDVLVNNAGAAPLADLTELSVADYELVRAVNMDAVFHLTRAVWPIMKAQGAGVIVNVSSRSSVDPFPGFAVYGASKAWVNIFTQAVANEGKPYGIRAYAVAPSGVETGMFRELFPDVPGDRVLQPDDVAAVIESVCDQRMAHCTGTVIHVQQ